MTTAIKKAAKTTPTEKESSELFDITVGSVQLIPLGAIRVGWAMLVGDASEKSS